MLKGNNMTTKRIISTEIVGLILFLILMTICGFLASLIDADTRAKGLVYIFLLIISTELFGSFVKCKRLKLGDK